MTEKRKSDRQKSFLRGIISPTDCNYTTIGCLVSDFTETGARLYFNSPQPITENVDLHIPIKRKTIRGKVVWHNGNEIGVAFKMNAAVDASHSSDGDLSTRVVQLEAEITALKKLIKRLQKNIEIESEAV